MMNTEAPAAPAPVATEVPELRAALEEILGRLPPVRPQKARTEPDFYGASGIIADAIGLKEPPLSYATWIHGWRESANPAFLVENGRSDWANLVINEGQAKTLRQNGFPMAIAAGLPFVYALKADPSPPPPIPGSLLIMPRHTLNNCTEVSTEDGYLGELGEVRRHFSLVVACVHPSCIENGYWCRRFEQAGIPWITGAGLSDINALHRMRTLFSCFEFVTSHLFGSHIAYAAACGCKVSIYGEIPAFRPESLAMHPVYKENPEALEEAVATTRPEYIRKTFSQFITPPHEAREHVAWALELCGEPFRRTPGEIARLLGWKWAEPEESFAGSNFQEIAPVLGWNSARIRFREKFEIQKEKRRELKREARLATRELAKAKEESRQIRQSFAWKMARPVYSIEKRLRRIFASKNGPSDDEK